MSVCLPFSLSLCLSIHVSLYLPGSESRERGERQKETNRDTGRHREREGQIKRERGGGDIEKARDGERKTGVHLRERERYTQDRER